MTINKIKQRNASFMFLDYNKISRYGFYGIVGIPLFFLSSFYHGKFTRDIKIEMKYGMCMELYPVTVIRTQQQTKRFKYRTTDELSI